MRLVALALTLALPKHGVLVTGESLGGIRLGMTPAQVERVWGTRFGRCRACRQRTWYFNYRPFRPDGAAVRFRRSRVDAVWTLWSPPGWRTRGGMRLGVNALEVNVRFGALVSIRCGNVAAWILTRRDVTTMFYVFGQKLWGFGLGRPGTSPCR